MSADPVRQLAQTNPLPNLTHSYGVLARDAKRKIDDLTNDLRRLDALAATLLEHDITVSTDLGPIGNAAAAARRDLEKQKPARTFELPR